MNDWFDAEQRVERAQQLSESQRWVEALAELDVALSINPNNATWHAQRGYLLEELGRCDEAVHAYERSLELEPGDRDVSLAYGSALVELGRYARAVEVFDELARAHSDFEPAYCHRIHAYAKLGLHDRAEEMFYLAQELDECCPHCFFHVAESLLARGQAEQAIYCWERVLELEPNYIGVNRRIGRAYRAQGELDKAREYFLREVREDAGNTSLLFELADLTLEAGEVASAAAKFAQIVELDPDHVKARFALGKICLAKGQPAQAWECFDAIGSDADDEPELGEFNLKAGEALYQLRRFDEARTYLAAAAAKDTTNPELRMLVGNCLLAMDKPDDAADWFRRVLALDAAHPLAHHNIAVCLFHTGRLEAGVEHCVKALESRPDYVMAMHNAAVAYIQLRRWREARAMLRRALRQDPGNDTLARLYRRMWRARLRSYVGNLIAVIRRLFGRHD
ncbi:MAG: tetratricopeptide repeat protein [Phycisphaerales bacterium]|nr:MAG: tetratricopeptide repeat protein [Phycisphaerales bacterium]